MKPIELIAAVALVVGLWPGRAQAQVSRVFVSVSGNDSNDCLQPASACRTLNAGIAKVDANGEVIVINTGSFAGANITKGVKINVPSGAIAFSASSVVVNAPAATVVIRGLTLKALTPGAGNGIEIQSAGTVLVENVVLDGWNSAILVRSGAGAVKVGIKDTTMRNNARAGVEVLSTGATVSIDQSRFERNLIWGLFVNAAARVSLTRSFLAGNLNGIEAAVAGAVVDVSRSTISGSTHNGLLVQGGLIRVAESVITANQTGLLQIAGAIESFKDNILKGNITESAGTIAQVVRK